MPRGAASSRTWCVLPLQGKAFAPPMQRLPPKRPVLRRAPGRASGSAIPASSSRQPPSDSQARPGDESVQPQPGQQPQQAAEPVLCAAAGAAAIAAAGEHVQADDAGDKAVAMPLRTLQPAAGSAGQRASGGTAAEAGSGSAAPARPVLKRRRVQKAFRPPRQAGGQENSTTAATGGTPSGHMASGGAAG